MEAPAYDQRVVLFLDILGFKELIQANRGAEVWKALNATKQAQERGFHGANDMRLTAFSDSVVASDVVGDGFGFVRLTQYASYLSWELLSLGILTRGAISHGDLYHNDGVVFGPALVKSYEMESKQAIYPRILVTPEVKAAYIAHVMRTRPPLFQEVAQHFFRSDFDGAEHLHLLGSSAHSPGIDGLNGKKIEPGQSRTYTAIEEVQAKASCLLRALESNRPSQAHPSAAAKHHWFKNYLAETLRLYGLPSD